MKNVYFLHCILVVLCLCNGYNAQTNYQGLGTGAYLPELNTLLSDHPSSRSFFTSTTFSNVVKIAPFPVKEEMSRFFYNSTDLFHELAKGLEITGGFPTLKLSLEYTYHSINRYRTDIASLYIVSYSYSTKMEVMTDKIFSAELNAEFVTDLHALPRKISEAGKGPSWIAYDGFLRKWGSHYVTAVYTGSWLQQWSLAMVSQSYTEKDYNLRACLKLGGMTKILKPCVPFLERDINSAISFNMTDVLYLKGGLNETRAKIRDNLTPELYEQFMLEGSSNSTTPVLYKYKPIWELLTEKYGRNSSEWQLARNIEAYYEGYLAYNCVKMQAGGGDKLLTVQDLVPVLDDFGYSYYVCMRSCRGCHFDNDCHYAVGEFKCGDEPCYCYGPTCIETDEDGHAQVRLRQTGRCAFGENTSCKYKAHGGKARCVCKREDEPGCKDGNITIWSQVEVITPPISHSITLLTVSIHMLTITLVVMLHLFT